LGEGALDGRGLMEVLILITIAIIIMISLFDVVQGQ
jgi:hypothetical protein